MFGGSWTHENKIFLFGTNKTSSLIIWFLQMPDDIYGFPKAQRWALCFWNEEGQKNGNIYGANLKSKWSVFLPPPQCRTNLNIYICAALSVMDLTYLPILFTHDLFNHKLIWLSNKAKHQCAQNFSLLIGEFILHRIWWINFQCHRFHGKLVGYINSPKYLIFSCNSS